MSPWRPRRCTSNANLTGKTAIVTGSNTGIGKETVRDLARRGAKVIMACRSLDKANEAADDIRRLDPKANIVVMKLDLASFDSICKFAKEILNIERHIDILVNNAGLMCPKSRTVDGFDMIFGTNHLGTFLLTYLLLDRIKESAPSRIVTVSSSGHAFVSSINWDDVNFDKPRSYPSWKAYAQSKLANVLFSKELAKRLEGTGVTTYALHPGFVETEFNRYNYETGGAFLRGSITALTNVFAKTVEEGAQTTIYCAVDETQANKTGLYYENCREKTPSRAARNAEAAKRLWELSIKLTGIENDSTVRIQ